MAKTTEPAHWLQILTGAACIALLAQCQPAAEPSACANVNGCAAATGNASVPVMEAVPTATATSDAAARPASTVAPAQSSAAGASAAGASAAGASAAGSQGGSNASAGNAAPAAGASGALSSVASAAGASGMASGAASAGTTAAADAKGVPLAKRGDSKTTSREYLNLGDFRVIVNKWGSDELMCNTMMKVFVNDDASFGWSFDRGGCGGNKQKPDYPEIEFGIHPFGAASSFATTPSFSSTTVLPIQIKDIMSASVLVDGLDASIQKGTTWNTDVEFWLSQKNPLTEADPGVYAELIAFWGWQDSWGCDKSGSVTAGDKTYSLCHQDDQWANGKWRYFQFRGDGGSIQSYSGKVDIKAFLDWLVQNHSYSTDLWLTRIEVGSELDDNTAGTVTLKNLTFEVNGTSKSAQLAP